MLKAAFGGGGRGMREIHKMEVSVNTFLLPSLSPEGAKSDFYCFFSRMSKKASNAPDLRPKLPSEMVPCLLKNSSNGPDTLKSRY